MYDNLPRKTRRLIKIETVKGLLAAKSKQHVL